MRKELWCIALGLAVFTSGCAQTAPAGLSDADRTSIKHAQDEWVRLTNAKDWPGAAKAYWTTDGVILPPNGPPATGRDAIADWLKAFPPFSDFSLAEVTVEGRGDLAYVRGTYKLTVTPPGAPAPVPDQGKHLTIFKKQTDGSWLASIGIFNSDLPMPTAAPSAAPATK